MTGAWVLVAVIVLLTTRTRKQRRTWKKLLRAGAWLLWWPVLLAGWLVLPRRRSRGLRRKRHYAASDDRPGQGPRYFTHAQKQQLLAVAGYQCQRYNSLGQRCPARSELRADHKIPYSWGGLTTIRNGQILCNHHNDSKGAKFADPGGEALARRSRIRWPR